jgi:hypothetical protein
MNWNVDSQMSFLCLSSIMTHLLRMPLTSDREGTYSLVYRYSFTQVDEHCQQHLKEAGWLRRDVTELARMGAFHRKNSHGVP